MNNLARIESDWMLRLGLYFLDNDDRMSSKRRNLSALVFLLNLITKVNLIRISLTLDLKGKYHGVFGIFC